MPLLVSDFIVTISALTNARPVIGNRERCLQAGMVSADLFFCAFFTYVFRLLLLLG